MEILLIVGVIAALWLWGQHVVGFSRGADTAAAHLASHMSKAEAQETYAELNLQYVKKGLLLPPERPSQEDFELMVHHAAACLDRIDELNGQPHGPANRALLRKRVLVKFHNDVNQMADLLVTEEDYQRTIRKEEN